MTEFINELQKRDNVQGGLLCILYFVLTSLIHSITQISYDIELTLKSHLRHENVVSEGYTVLACPSLHPSVTMCCIKYIPFV